MERKKEEEKKENGTDAEKRQTLKANRRSIDRLSQPKQIREKPEAEAKAEGTPAPKVGDGSACSFHALDVDVSAFVAGDVEE